ncbi:peptidase [Allorhizobium taibaishanense]|uniref:Peptidase n=2 Tax=Allorhizobium taibaishanense TaxID=887144 RepID=A0A1Q9AB42_9HYPH|nr:peptidase [Allorhizobium taibaishanense]
METRGFTGLMLVLASFGVAAPALTDNASAETIVRKSTSTFVIGGHSAKDLDGELERKGPHTSGSGLRHPGATRIRFGGTMDYLRRPGHCSIGNVKVTVSIKIIVPSWKNRSKADPELGLIWDTLSADINRHEARHAEIAVQHARDLDEKLKALPSASSCEALQQTVSELTDQVTREHDADQIRFDRIEAVNFNNRIMRLLTYRYHKTQKP